MEYVSSSEVGVMGWFGLSCHWYINIRRIFLKRYGDRFDPERECSSFSSFYWWFSYKCDFVKRDLNNRPG